jgi:hypothetical protein
MAPVTVLGVLGPLLLRGPDGPVRVGSARQRRLLTALAAHLGRPVDVGLLAELMWPDGAPADPAGAVQTNVARLRRLLPDGVRLETTPEGYRLLADRASLDVTAFVDELAAAGVAEAAEARLDLLGSALARWRGCPYAELDHPSLHPEAARLAELRVEAAQRHAEALLAVGRVGEAVAELEALVAAKNLQRHFTFLGHREDVSALLTAADAFVLPSRSEAFPNGAIEAMAAGLPVVASNVGGLLDLIHDGRTGMLVQPGNPEHLAGALRRLMTDRPFAARIARAARAHVRERYSFDRMVQAFEDLYSAGVGARTFSGAHSAQQAAGI